MPDEPCSDNADAKAALFLIHVLILTLIETRVVDAEVVRRIADEALSSGVDLDPAVITPLVLRLNSVIQDTYAAQPVNTGTPRPEGAGFGTEPLS
jgi:hypothetical protein